MIIRALYAPLDWPRIANQVPCVLCADTRGIVAEHPTRGILGAVIFDNWSDNLVHGHVWGATPLVWRHNLHHEALRYVFEQTGREIVMAMVEEDNRASQAFCEHLGFREVHRIPDGYRKGVDFVALELRKADYERRYERGPGPRITPAAAA